MIADIFGHTIDSVNTAPGSFERHWFGLDKFLRTRGNHKLRSSEMIADLAEGCFLASSDRSKES